MRCPRCNIEVSDSFDTCAVCKTPLVASDDKVSGSTLANRIAKRETGSRRHPTGPAPQQRRSRKRPTYRTGPMPPVPVDSLDGGWTSEGHEPKTGPEWPTHRPLPSKSRAERPPKRPTGPPVDATTPSAPPTQAELADPSAQAAIATKFLTVDPEVERGTRMMDVPLAPVVKRAVRQRKKERKKEDAFDPDNPLDEVLKSIRLLYLGMHRFDRWTLWVLVASFVTAFLPWSYVQGIGLVSGIEGIGVASGAAALLALGCLHQRTTRRRLAGLYLVLQFVAAASICVAPVYTVVIDAEAKMAYGMLATVLGGLLSILLTLIRILRSTA